MINNIYEYFTYKRYENFKYHKVFTIDNEISTVFVNASDKEEYSALVLPDDLKSIILKIFRFTKYQLDGKYNFKKNYPSARGKYPFFPIINYYGYYYLYDSLYDNFRYLNYISENALKIEIFICLDIWRIGSIYGEFSIILSMLENGHILSEINNSISSTEYKLKNQKIIFQNIDENLLENASDTYIVSLISIDKIGKSDIKGSTKRNFIQKKFNYSESIESINLHKFFDKFNKDIDIKFETININNDLNYYRHSHNQDLGFFQIERNNMFNFTKYLQVISHYLNHINDYNFYFIINNVKDVDQGVYVYKHNQLILLTKKFDINNILHDYKEYNNLENIPFLIIISTKPEDYSYEKFIEVQIEVGYILNNLITLYSEKGRFVRPIRNIDDYYCSKVCNFEKEEYVIYCGIFGLGHQSTTLFLEEI
ncbi:hypothetical protein [Staphylococcus chromogenes]|uniref:hypothetical protein n=1 Tax=Staphylococcus chromogenes TaxID=46126 RepID=UPI0028847BCA|nr:hypothetical protein [Staphylococcus chromogenes]MDT0716826.1 hypothetical protein [Staphylococcus chromogenes]MDT0736812.1 hypothetical protein [Staphylococcus chromogenes]MDT0750888.1 hypothetical protein [Staphylococcus chromogenes]